ncbi:hypothetical protein MPSEU_000087700 [Mayamaea pseudoterrestris]|nr:hypothetical protein MPSEU_000087700 [Mayamaea pseudoterrestris]
MATKTSLTNVHSFYETPTSCQNEWNKYLQANKRHPTLMDGSFIESPNELLLASCASDGNLYFWKVPNSSVSEDLMQVDDDDDDYAALAQHDGEYTRMPFRVCRIHTGSLSTMQFHIVSHEKQLLVVGGDAGVVVIDFVDFWNQLCTNTSSTCSLKDLNLLVPPQHFHPYPSPDPNVTAQVNDTLIVGDHLYAAVGDEFGLYKWHLETKQLLKTFHNTPYLHSIQSLKSETDATFLLTGGEEGILSIWNCHNDELIQDISLNDHGRKGVRKSIKSIAVLDDYWFSIAGELIGSSNSTNNDNGCHGFLSTFSVPTRSVVAYTETLSRPQRCAFLPNRTLATCANESAVSHWHFTCLDKVIQKTCCSSLSVHVLAVAPDGRLAMGGVGGVIDLYDATGQEQLFQFVTTNTK